MAALVDRPEAARPARHDAGDLDGRVRPHAAHQQAGRPRPLPAGLDDASWPAAASRAARSSAGPTRRAARVEERPVSAIDFMATVCKALGIDYTKEFNTRDGRPIRVVDKGEKVVKELF